MDFPILSISPPPPNPNPFYCITLCVPNTLPMNRRVFIVVYIHPFLKIRIWVKLSHSSTMSRDCLDPSFARLQYLSVKGDFKWKVGIHFGYWMSNIENIYHWYGPDIYTIVWPGKQLLKIISFISICQLNTFFDITLCATELIFTINHEFRCSNSQVFHL